MTDWRVAFAPLRANAILVVFCFPFLDLRYLTVDAQFGRPRWHWPPSEDHKRVEFVGELGRVVRVLATTRPGALDLRSAIRFDAATSPAWQSVAGRTIFADNLGQVQAHIGFLAAAQEDLQELLERIGHGQVEVRRSGGGPRSLTEAGLAVAERYLFATALTSDPRPQPRPVTPLPRLVREGAGSPFLILVPRPGEALAPVEALRFEGHARLAAAAASWSGAVGDQDLDIWLLPMHPRPPGTRMQVVQSLCRIIGWMQELAILQRVAADPGGLTLDPAELERFVRDRAGKLRRSSFEGWPVEPILARVNHMSAAQDMARASFAASVRPLLSKEAGNDILATLGRIDLHRDALQLEAGSATISAPKVFSAKVSAIEERAARAPQHGQGELPAVVRRLRRKADDLSQELLRPEDIRRIQQLLVEAGLAGKRNVLLAALDSELIGTLQRDDRPDAQLLLDLMALNRILPANGAAPPLAELLHTAATLMQGASRSKADLVTKFAKKSEKQARRRLAP